MNTRWTACLVVGVALVAVVVYVWFQDHGDTSDECSSPPSNQRKQKEDNPNIKANIRSLPRSSLSQGQETKLIPKQEKSADDPGERSTEITESKEAVIPDDGVIKYNCQWTQRTLSYSSIRPLLAARNRLFGLGLIGVYKDSGIGFGNISVRYSGGNKLNTKNTAFYITGTQTGNVEPEHMNESHFSLVTRCDIAGNELFCEGPVRASSEGLTHCAVYALNDDIQCVVHVHHHRLWTECMDRIPTTDRNVPYGTPEMAREVERLYREDDGRLREEKVFVMGGHEDGLISFGHSMEEAMEIMIKLFRAMDSMDHQHHLGIDGNANGNISESVGSENRSNGVDSGNGSGSGTETGAGTTTEESSTGSEQNGHQNMNINIIDDYATPVLASRNGTHGSSRNNEFVEVDSDNLVL